MNVFDCVNGTGVEAHRFEIEREDLHCRDITYTYNYYGIPKITEDIFHQVHARRPILPSPSLSSFQGGCSF